MFAFEVLGFVSRVPSKRLAGKSVSEISYLLNKGFITKHQYGFIKRKSVTSNLLQCLEDWTQNLQSRHVNDVIFVDFKKAFDTVCHSKLLYT